MAKDKLSNDLTTSPEDNLRRLESSQARTICFDRAAACGNFSGLAAVTLTSVRLTPVANGQVRCDEVVAGHLRMSLAGATDLRNALNKVIDLMTDPTLKGQPN